MRMGRIVGDVVLAGVALGLAGCVNPVVQKEDLLAAAGFAFKPADTPEKVANLAKLPPHKFARQVRNGKVVFLYADPTVCDCLYAGDEAAYDRYKQEVFQQRIADEQRMAADEQEDAAMQAQMDWGLWGGPWGPYVW